MNRRQFLALCSALTASGVGASAYGFGEADLFTFGLIEYDSPSWNPRPTALRRLMLEVEMTTSILIADDYIAVRPEGTQLYQSPILVLAGDRGFDPWTEDARAVMRTFLAAGGTLLVDGSEGRDDGAFYTSIQREVEAFMPGEALQPISSDHVLFRAFYLIDDAPGRVAVSNVMEGVIYDDRLAVIYSHNDLMGAWARDNLGNFEFECYPGGERQRTMAYRMGVNIAMYALCLDYKEDQVHVTHLLRRRQWRVD